MNGSNLQPNYDEQFELEQRDGAPVFQWRGAGIENLSSVKLMDIISQSKQGQLDLSDNFVSQVKNELVRRNYFLQDELIGDC